MGQADRATVCHIICCIEQQTQVPRAMKVPRKEEGPGGGRIHQQGDFEWGLVV